MPAFKQQNPLISTGDRHAFNYPPEVPQWYCNASFNLTKAFASTYSIFSSVMSLATPMRRPFTWDTLSQSSTTVMLRRRITNTWRPWRLQRPEEEAGNICSPRAGPNPTGVRQGFPHLFGENILTRPDEADYAKTWTYSKYHRPF